MLAIIQNGHSLFIHPNNNNIIGTCMDARVHIMLANCSNHVQ